MAHSREESEMKHRAAAVAFALALSGPVAAQNGTPVPEGPREVMFEEWRIPYIHVSGVLFVTSYHHEALDVRVVLRAPDGQRTCETSVEVPAGGMARVNMSSYYDGDFTPCWSAGYEEGWSRASAVVGEGSPPGSLRVVARIERGETYLLVPVHRHTGWYRRVLD